MLIVGALPAPSPSSILGVLGPFLLFFDPPELPAFAPVSSIVELVPPALSTGWNPSAAASFMAFELPESLAPVSEPVRPVPSPVSPGAGSAYVFFFSLH
jgi:hypothetical protein